MIETLERCGGHLEGRGDGSVRLGNSEYGDEDEDIPEGIYDEEEEDEGEWLIN